MSSVDHKIPPFASTVFGIALIVAPLFLLASSIAFIVAGEGINQGVLGGTIGVWSVILLIIAFVGLFRLIEPIAPRASAILTITAVIGFATGVAVNIEVTIVGLLGPEYDAAIDAALTGGDAVAILAFIPGVFFVPITFVATGIVLWRSGALAKWTAVLFVAAGILFVIGRAEQITVIALVTDVVIFAAMAPIGWMMLGGSRAVSPVPAA